MSVSVLEVTSLHAIPVVPLNGSVTLSTVSGDTIYYGQDQTVSSSNNTGSLTSGGSSVTLTVQGWVRSAGVSAMQMVSGAVAQDVVVGSDGLGGSGGTALSPTAVQAVSVTAGQLPASVPNATSGWYDSGPDASPSSQGNLAIGTSWTHIVVPGAHGNVAFGHGLNTIGQPLTGNLGQLTTGATNTAVGAGDLIVLTTGSRNVALGGDILTALVAGDDNVGLGCQTLQNLVSGSSNLAAGTRALFAETTGSDNVALGGNALAASVGQTGNVALGYNALSTLAGFGGCTAVGYNAAANISNTGNTAVGAGALQGGAAPTNVTNNTAIGYQALKGTTTAQGSTAVGYSSFVAATTGGGNVGLGASSGLAVTTGTNNTLIGTSAGRSMVLGQGNTHVGFGAGFTSSTDKNYMTLIGYQTIGTGNGAVAIGTDHTGAGATASTANYFVLGTANHRLFVPGLLTADPHVVGELWANAGVVTVSAG